MSELPQAPMERGEGDGGAVRPLTNIEIADSITTYHKPDEAGVEAITNIRQAAAALIVAILANCPRNPDRTAAIRKAREAMMTANASIVVPPFSI